MKSIVLVLLPCSWQWGAGPPPAAPPAAAAVPPDRRPRRPCWPSSTTPARRRACTPCASSPRSNAPRARTRATCSSAATSRTPPTAARSYASRLRAFGYSRTGCTSWKVGEIIGWGRGSEGGGARIFRQWMKSPVHRAVILQRSFRDIGVGRAKGTLRGLTGVSHVHGRLRSPGEVAPRGRRRRCLGRRLSFDGRAAAIANPPPRLHFGVAPRSGYTANICS